MEYKAVYYVLLWREITVPVPGIAEEEVRYVKFTLLYLTSKNPGAVRQIPTSWACPEFVLEMPVAFAGVG